MWKIKSCLTKMMNSCDTCRCCLLHSVKKCDTLFSLHILYCYEKLVRKFDENCSFLVRSSFLNDNIVVKPVLKKKTLCQSYQRNKPIIFLYYHQNRTIGSYLFDDLHSVFFQYRLDDD